jgi:hypothetical protein
MANVLVNKLPALTSKDKLLCTFGQGMIKITDSGQGASAGAGKGAAGPPPADGGDSGEGNAKDAQQTDRERAEATAGGGGGGAAGGGGGGGAADGGKTLADVDKNVLDAFGSDAKVTELPEDTKAFRYSGGDSKPSGRWFTPNPTENPARDLALPPWNTAEKMDEVTLPKGTWVVEGTVAPQPQWGQPGGGYQYYVL